MTKTLSSLKLVAKKLGVQLHIHLLRPCIEQVKYLFVKPQDLLFESTNKISCICTLREIIFSLQQLFLPNCTIILPHPVLKELSFSILFLKYFIFKSKKRMKNRIFWFLVKFSIVLIFPLFMLFTSKIKLCYEQKGKKIQMVETLIQM